MIGFFDSGVGGFNSLKAFRKILPLSDVVYLADRKNAPYGTKTEDEILSLAAENITRLSQMGAQKVLIACCTASTLWEKLSISQRNISVPIILPSIKRLDSRSKRILVIATERTVMSKCFTSGILSLFPEARVTEVAMQSLVASVEEGTKKNSLSESTRRDIERLVRLADEYRPDTLILGCTHFSSVENLIQEAIPYVKIINPAHIGAMEMVECVRKYGINVHENGRIIYT